MFVVILKQHKRVVSDGATEGNTCIVLPIARTTVFSVYHVFLESIGKMKCITYFCVLLAPEPFAIH